MLPPPPLTPETYPQDRSAHGLQVQEWLLLEASAPATTTNTSTMHLTQCGAGG